MKITTNKYIFSAAALFLVAIVVASSGLLGPKLAFANPFYVGTKAKSAIATTTLAYMTPGTATSTTVYDSYEQNGTNQPNGGNQTLPDSVSFLLQGAASSTLTVVNVQCEFGDDEYNAAQTIVSTDWYQNELTGPTTTAPGVQNVGTPNSYSFTFASSTIGGAGMSASANNRFQKLVTCAMPTRYVRAVVTITGGNAGLWVGIIPKKQRN